MRSRSFHVPAAAAAAAAAQLHVWLRSVNSDIV